MLTYAVSWSGEMATSCGSLSTSIVAISRYVPVSYRRTLPPTLSTATRPRVPVGLLKSMRPLPATPSFMPPPFLVAHARGARTSFLHSGRGKRSTALPRQANCSLFGHTAAVKRDSHQPTHHVGHPFLQQLPPPRHASRATPPPGGGEYLFSPLLFKEGWRECDGVVTHLRKQQGAPGAAAADIVCDLQLAQARIATMADRV